MHRVMTLQPGLVTASILSLLSTVQYKDRLLGEIDYTFSFWCQYFSTDTVYSMVGGQPGQYLLSVVPVL